MFKKQSLEFEMVTTKGGDKGETGLYSGERLRKDDFTFEVLGDLDELNSFLGLLKLEACNIETYQEFIDKIQTKIIQLSSIIATKEYSKEYKQIKQIKEKDIEILEIFYKAVYENTTIEPVFINPGKLQSSAYADICRAICRRCERRLVTLIRDYKRTDLYNGQIYLNRLSDFLFTLGRFYEQNGDIQDLKRCY